MTTPIMRELAHHEFLRQRLQADFPDADDETLRDTLDGLTDLDEMLAELTRSYLDDKAFAAALRQRVEEMRQRLSRFEDAADKKRSLLATVMDRADIKLIKEADFTLSCRQAPPSLTIFEEDQLPAEFLVPQPPKLDRRRLLQSLKDGEAVPGAALSNGGITISVRTK